MADIQVIIDQIQDSQNHVDYILADKQSRENIVTLQADVNNLKLGNIGDTKNTAGSTNNNNKLFIIGSLTQEANPQTYSNSNIYIQNNSLYTYDGKVITVGDVNIADLTTSTTTVPSEATVKNYVDNNTNLTLKGSVDDESELPSSNIKIGDTYLITTAGTYDYIDCLAGDFLIALNDTPIEWTAIHNSFNTNNFIMTANRGLTKSGTSVGHTNNPLNQDVNQQDFYPITFDEYGHITSYGNPLDPSTLISIQPGDTVTDISDTSNAGIQNQYSRADHQHRLTSQTIEDVLNYIPYDGDSNLNYFSSIRSISANNSTVIIQPNASTDIDISNLLQNIAGNSLNITYNSDDAAQDGAGKIIVDFNNNTIYNTDILSDFASLNNIYINNSYTNMQCSFTKSNNVINLYINFQTTSSASINNTYTYFTLNSLYKAMGYQMAQLYDTSPPYGYITDSSLWINDDGVSIQGRLKPSTAYKVFLSYIISN